jgi:hypothetical protein
MAQVYSQNAVGYVNTVVYPGFNLIANPLVQTDTQLGTLIPTAPDSTSFYSFDPVNGFTIRQFVDGLGWDPDGSPTIPNGNGFFLQSVSATPFTITFVGDVAQGTLTIPIVNGFNLIASKVPQAGTLTALGFPGEDSDSAYVYGNGPGGETGYSINQFVDGLGWDPEEPVLGVGKAMWLNSSGTHASWVRTFSVN